MTFGNWEVDREVIVVVIKDRASRQGGNYFVMEGQVTERLTDNKSIMYLRSAGLVGRSLTRMGRDKSQSGG
jgi:hypothetical protein